MLAKKLHKILIIFFQLILLTAALYIGREWANHFNIIPKFLFRLPSLDITTDIFKPVLSIFLSIHAAVFLLTSFILKNTVFATIRRTVQEIYATLFAFTLCTLYIFFATSIPFSPDFFLGTGLVFVLFMILSQLVMDFRNNSLSGPLAAPGRIMSIIGDFFRYMVTISGIVVILFAASPLILMKLYVSNRDVANFVTQIRLSLTQEDYEDYVLVDAVSGLRFRQPIMSQFPQNDPDTLYVLERHGRLYKVNYGGDGAKTLLLDFTEQVGDVDMENGALGFDLHPEFAQEDSPNSGHVYLYYTHVKDKKQANRLSRFDLKAENLAARLSSETTLIDFERSADGYHNGGSVEFGPDGFLYLGMGEASSNKAHQSISHKLHGGILRIDVDLRGADISHPIPRRGVDTRTQGYMIPNDNPFVGQKDALEEFWALGLRNPFRISFDKKTDALWAGDVGSTEFEEVNIITKGGNYQFPYSEGVTKTHREKPETIIGTEQTPYYVYKHTAYERAIIGGVVYRHDAIAALTDKYVYMDNYSGKIYTLTADQTSAQEPEILARSTQVAQRGPTSLIASPEGHILITTLGHSLNATGRLLRLLPANDESRALLATQEKEQQDAAQTESHHTHGAGYAKMLITENYNTNCARCHGTDGTGNGPDKDLLETLIPDFTDPAFHEARTDAILFSVIQEGGEARGLSYEMPPWDGLLSAEEIKGMVKHIRAFKSEK